MKLWIDAYSVTEFSDATQCCNDNFVCFYDSENNAVELPVSLIIKSLRNLVWFYLINFKIRYSTQQTFTCSKLTIETIEKDEKYVIVNFELNYHLYLVFLLLNCNRSMFTEYSVVCNNIFWSTYITFKIV